MSFRNIHSLFLLISFLFAGFPADSLAQKDPVIVLDFSTFETGGRRLGGVEMRVLKGGSVVASATSSNSGKYSKTIIPFEEVYTLEFSKPGYVSKVIEVDAKKGYHKDDIQNRENYISAPVELFPSQPQTDYSVITSSPVGKLRIDPTNGQLELDATYTSKRSKEIEKFLTELNSKKDELEKKYVQLVSEGDKHFSSSKYEEAMAKYKEALAIKPEDQTVQQKITDTELKLEELAEQKARDANFNKLIQEGDQLVAANKFDEAISTYQKAQAIKPNDKIPPQKIKEANDKKAAAQNSEKDKLYAGKMQEAATAFKEKDYSYAKTLYKQASDIKPTEKEPKDKMAEIDNLIAAQLEQEKKYNELIGKGDKAILTKNYDEAITSFTDASALKPNEAYPKEQLAHAKKLKEASLAADQKEKEYKDLIASADKLLLSKEYEKAKTEYEKALKIKSQDSYASGKVNEISEILKKMAEDKAKQEQKEKQFQDLVAAGNSAYEKNEWEQAKVKYKEAQTLKPEDKELADKLTDVEKKIVAKQQNEQAEKANREQYNTLIKKGDSEYGSANYTQAKASFNQALELYADEKYPKDKLVDIEKKLVELADAKAKEEAEKLKRAEYDGLMNQADGDFTAQKWEEAKTKYEQASKLFPNEQPPKKRIEEINNKLKEIAEEKARNEADKVKRKQYDEFITAADGYFNSSNWEESKQKYNEALKLYPNEKHPKDRLEAIQKKMAELADSKAKEDAEKVKREQYTKLMADANAAFTTKLYDEALAKYISASDLYPNEPLPKEKIDQIKRIQAENKAKEETEAAQNAKFTRLMSEGEAHLVKKEWEKARDKFAEAWETKKDPAAKTKLDQAEKTLAETRSAEEAEKAKRQKYEQLITKGGNDFEAQRWVEAKQKFEEARDIYPNEPLPQKKIAEIDKFLEDAKTNEAKEQLKKQYLAKIAEANAARDKQDWENAKNLYKQANAIKADENYPQQQIDWINEQMQLASIAEADKAYQKILQVADKKLAEKEYNGARDLYNRALGIKSDDPYPKKQLIEIDRLIAEENANKSKEELLKKYKEIIAQADGARDMESWDKAKSLYKQAHDVKPDENYSQEQINWINSRMKELADENAEKQYRRIIEVADNNFSTENYTEARKLYERALSFKPDDPYPRQKIAEIEQRLLAKANEAKDDASRQKENERYQNYLNRAKELEALKKYKEAIGEYRGALSVKPDSPFPRQKIDELTDLLGQLAEESTKKDDKERMNKLGQDLNSRDQYGEEVFGMTEDELQQLITQSNIDESTYRAEKMVEYKDTKTEETTKATTAASDKLDERNEELRALEMRITEDDINRDKPRQEVVEQVEKYQDSKINAETRATEKATQNTYETEEALRQLEQKRTNQFEDLDTTRQRTLFEVEQYKDAEINTVENYDNSNSEKTYATHVHIEKLQEERAQENIDNDKTRQNSVVAFEGYQNEKIQQETNRTNDYTERSLTAKEDLERLQEKRQHLFDEADNTRVRNSEQMEKYQDGQIETQGEMERVQTSKGFALQQDMEKLKEDRAQADLESDKTRQQQLVDMEKYQDRKIDEQERLAASNEKSTYSTHQAANQLEDKIIKRFDEADNTRKRIVDEVEGYQDAKQKQQEQLEGISEKKTYAVYQAALDLETKISQQFIDADNTRQENLVQVEQYKDKRTEQSIQDAVNYGDKNIDRHVQLEKLSEERNQEFTEADKTREVNASNMVAYQDQQIQAERDLSEGKSDKLLLQAEKMEEIRTFDPQSFTEGYRNEIAMTYGQGVTERKFQRKNARGEVIEVTIERIVVVGNKGSIYKKVMSRHGIVYFKNNGIISESIWDTETNIRTATN